MVLQTISGASQNDMTTIIGTTRADLINVESSSQYVESLDGYDTISGGSAIDNVIVDSGTEDDVITFQAEALNSKLILGSGKDWANINDYSGSIYGGAGDDSVTVAIGRTLSNALVRGDGGEDNFSLVNTSDSTINSNSDDDNISISGHAINTQVYGGRQQDTIIITNASDSLIRGDANEDKITINGNLSGTIINGNANDDQLIIESLSVKNSTVYGGGGNDNIDISSDAILIFGNKGDDDIDLTSSANHSIFGGAGNDSIDSNSTQPLFLQGEMGSDQITVTAGAVNGAVHTIDGGSSNDILTGSSGDEYIDGGTEDNGKDTITSTGGNDTIYSRAGDDLINLEAGVNAGNVRVQAGNGNDVIEVTLDELSYADIIRGEAGSDTLAVVGSPANFSMWEGNTIAERAFNSISSIETLAFGTLNSSYRISGTKTIELSAKVQTAGILNIDASNATGGGDDVLEVNALLFTSAADLTFTGSNDKDVNVNFTGGSGDDTFTTGKITEDAGDSLTGGPGVDTFNIIATNRDAEVLDLGVGGYDVLIVSATAKGVNATVKQDYTTTTITSNNKSLSDVVLNAESGVDINMNEASGSFGFVINGGSAASTLQGSSHNDSITGNAAADNLKGYLGNDTIEGGGGADSINGGKGIDYIKDAGNGADIITYDIGSSLVIQNTGTDVVTLKATRRGAYVVATAGVRTVNASTSTSSVTLNGSAAGENKVTYTAGTGDDTIMGGGSNDVLTGNDGNDSITGGLGTDTIDVGNGINSVVFTGGLTVDAIVNFTSDDIGVFDLSEIETADAVENGETLDFVTGINISVAAGEAISMQTVNGATVLTASTNVLNYTEQAVANAAALETELETGGGIITTNGALAENDAFVIQYKNSNTNTYSYAIAHLEDAGVAASTKIAAWEVTDVATTNLTEAFGSGQFSFVS